MWIVWSSDVGDNGRMCSWKQVSLQTHTASQQHIICSLLQEYCRKWTRAKNIPKDTWRWLWFHNKVLQIVIRLSFPSQASGEITSFLTSEVGRLYYITQKLTYYAIYRKSASSAANRQDFRVIQFTGITDNVFFLSVPSLQQWRWLLMNSHCTVTTVTFIMGNCTLLQTEIR